MALVDRPSAPSMYNSFVQEISTSSNEKKRIFSDTFFFHIP